MSLKYRLLVIVALIGASIWALFPRTVVERVKRNGVFVYDTVRRVPLKRGLDLQGGMYLALEVSYLLVLAMTVAKAGGKTARLCLPRITRRPYPKSPRREERPNR